jgi:hypothetical protein
MKFNYALVILAFTGSQVFAMDVWRDSKFPEKLMNRYPAYREKIKTLSGEINNYFRMFAKNPGVESTLDAAKQEFANLICEVTRKEVASSAGRDARFADTMISRYPSYRDRIKSLNDEITLYSKAAAARGGNPAAEALLENKKKELADLLCDAARREIKDQFKETRIEESEFEIF